ncbi:unnamed protein product [Caretta caretta]
MLCLMALEEPLQIWLGVPDLRDPLSPQPQRQRRKIPALRTTVVPMLCPYPLHAYHPGVCGLARLGLGVLVLPVQGLGVELSESATVHQRLTPSALGMVLEL